jgi:DNA-directed RNA polymerase alpha subunit
MSLQDDIEQLFKISESSVAASKKAIEVIRSLHIKYCELFRNEIDNLWSENDGRRQMCGDFADATDLFRTLVSMEAKLAKQRKTASKLLTKINSSDDIGHLEFTLRTEKCLRAENINTVQDLCSSSKSALLKTPNLGKKSLMEIEDILESVGLSLKES